LPLVTVIVLVAAVLGVAFATLVGLDPAAFDVTGRVSNEALMTFGIKDDARILDGRLAGLARAGLVHLSLAHLVVNVTSLAVCAVLLWRLIPLTERTTKRAATIAAILVVTSACGFLLSFFVRNGLSAGASAGVFGLLGAVPAALLMRRDLSTPRIRLSLAVLLFGLGAAAVAVLSGDGAVDHAAHLGGLISGAVCGLVFATSVGRVILGGAALGVVVLGFTSA
jgi:rhomboid protease GluP